MPGIGTRFGTRGLSIGPHSDRSTTTAEFPAPTGSQLVRDTLGEHIFEWFLRNKRAEWDSYRTQVTPWELERYLPRW